MINRDNIWFLIIGAIISFISFGSIVYGNKLWYIPAVVGVWLIFDSLSSIKNKNTAIQIFWKDKKKFLKLIFSMFMLGCTIELIGRFILNLWFYSPKPNIFIEFSILIGYIFILLSFREMYELLGVFVKNRFTLMVLSIILGIIIWEVPNLFISSWVYTIPYIHLEIFNINIVVIFGWLILIGFPVWICKEIIGRGAK